MTESRSRRVRVGVVVVAIVMAVIVSFGVYFTNNAVLSTISGQIALPSVLAGSRVVVGNPVEFMIGDTEAAKIKLTEQSTKLLLASTTVFNDCDVAGRECSTSTWAYPLVLLMFDGVAMPKNPKCAQSYLAGSGGYREAHVICVDSSKNLLYYHSWDSRSR